MKVICTQENLKNALMACAKVVSSSNTLPILNNILLKTENGSLKISATNLEMAITSIARCKVESEGAISVPAKIILDLVQNLPTGNLTLEEMGNELILITQTYNSKVRTLPADEFPPVPLVETTSFFLIDPLVFKSALDSVIFAASNSESQPEISGVALFINNDNLKIVATDRYRLAESKITLQSSAQTNSFILPQKSAQELSRLLSQTVSGELKISYTENQFMAEIEDTVLISRLVDGSYPDYQQIIPTSFSVSIVVPKQEITQALKASGIFSQGIGSVILNYSKEKQVLTIKSTGHDFGENRAGIPCLVDGSGEGELTLNYRYVLDAVAAIRDDEIVIMIIDDNFPVVFKPKSNTNYLSLIMPIKS